MKVLAAEADARWAAKPSFLDAPDKQQPAQMLQSRDPNSGLKQAHGAREDAQQAEPQSILKGGDEIAGDMAEEKQNEATLKVPKKAKESKEPKESPWKEADKGNPGDAWQPKEWKPSPARRRA
jgi:NADH dehydrogenase [ubiquinone] 1 alpha subcomplex assembly factor 2